MATEDSITELLKKVSADRRTIAQQRMKGVIDISGELVGEEKGVLLVLSGTTRYGIPRASVVTIQEDKSAPAEDTGAIFVRVEVQPDAEIQVESIVAAKDLVTRIGRKPFVFEMPSEAHRFAIPTQQVQAEQRAWLEQAKCEGWLRAADTPSFYLTSSPTPSPTASFTDTQNNDSISDSVTDYSTDSLSDVD